MGRLAVNDGPAPSASENQRNGRRDKKVRRKNAPVLHGLPKGFPAGYWLLRKSREESGSK